MYYICVKLFHSLFWLSKGVGGCECVIFVCASFILPFGSKGVGGCECVIFVCASFILPFGCKGVGG